jgi:hypothetical protein
MGKPQSDTIVHFGIVWNVIYRQLTVVFHQMECVPEKEQLCIKKNVTSKVAVVRESHKLFFESEGKI